MNRFYLPVYKHRSFLEDILVDCDVTLLDTDVRLHVARDPAVVRADDVTEGGERASFWAGDDEVDDARRLRHLVVASLLLSERHAAVLRNTARILSTLIISDTASPNDQLFCAMVNDTPSLPPCITHDRVVHRFLSEECRLFQQRDQLARHGHVVADERLPASQHPLLAVVHRGVVAGARGPGLGRCGCWGGRRLQERVTNIGVVHPSLSSCLSSEDHFNNMIS